MHRKIEGVKGEMSRLSQMRHKEWYWKGDKLCYRYKKCHHRKASESTVMENSKLPFRYWFVTMHLLTATKEHVLRLELQRQFEGTNATNPYGRCSKLLLTS